jgi:hypothetical protein
MLKIAARLGSNNVSMRNIGAPEIILVLIVLAVLLTKLPKRPRPPRFHPIPANDAAILNRARSSVWRRGGWFRRRSFPVQREDQ